MRLRQMCNTRRHNFIWLNRTTNTSHAVRVLNWPKRRHCAQMASNVFSRRRCTWPQMCCKHLRVCTRRNHRRNMRATNARS